MAIAKQYTYDSSKGIAHYVGLFAKNNKITNVEGGEDTLYFGVVGDTDYRITPEIKGGKIVLRAEENTRRIVEDALDKSDKKALTPDEQERLKAIVLQKVEEANAQYSRKGLGLLDVAKIVSDIQKSDAWKLLGFSSWEKFASAHFDFRLESIKEALGVTKRPELLELANEVGITKAYILSRKKSDLTSDDFNAAKNMSARDLADRIGMGFAGNKTSRAKIFSWKALNTFLEALTDEKGLREAQKELDRCLGSVNSRLAGIEERRSKNAQRNMQDAEFEAFRAWKASQTEEKKGLVTKK